MLLSAFLCATIGSASAAGDVNASAPATVFGAYFADWARYHAAPYKHEAADVGPIAPRIDRLMQQGITECVSFDEARRALVELAGGITAARQQNTTTAPRGAVA